MKDVILGRCAAGLGRWRSCGSGMQVRCLFVSTPVSAFQWSAGVTVTGCLSCATLPIVVMTLRTSLGYNYTLYRVLSWLVHAQGVLSSGALVRCNAGWRSQDDVLRASRRRRRVGPRLG